MDKFFGFLKKFRQTAHLMVGLPDYETYVRHQKDKHPDQPVLDRSAFIAECHKRRYGGHGTPSRCC